MARRPEPAAPGAATDARPAPQKVRSFAIEPRRRAVVTPLLRLAAAIALMAGGALLWRTAVDGGRPGALQPVTFREYATPRGQRAEFRLADGSRVVLGPATRLQVPQDYGRRARAVRLEGEAFFEVTHDDRQPFTVQTSRLVAHDLGTRFVVRAYAEDTTADVVVAEGKVAVGRDSSAAASPAPDRVVLSRGEGARATPAGQLAPIRDLSLDSYLGWTDGRLVFRRTPLDEAARQIARWHDVEVHLASPELGRRGFTAAFQPDEPASDILRTVATLLQLEVVQTGPRSYTLRAR